MRDLMRPKRDVGRSRNRSGPAPSERRAPSFGKGASSRRFRNSKRYGRKKRGWFWRWLWRLVLLICFISAVPMIILRYYDPPTSSFIELNKMHHNTNIKHQWLDMEDISLYFPNAVIASEDQQFPNHFGFDIKQIKLVLEERKKGQTRGASTITQPNHQESFSVAGPQLRSQGHRGVVGRVDGANSAQEKNPRTVHKLRSIRQIRVWYRSSESALLRNPSQPTQSKAIRTDRRQPTNTVTLQPGQTVGLPQRACRLYPGSNAKNRGAQNGRRIVGRSLKCDTRRYEQTIP